MKYLCKCVKLIRLQWVIWTVSFLLTRFIFCSCVLLVFLRHDYLEVYLYRWGGRLIASHSSRRQWRLITGHRCNTAHQWRLMPRHIGHHQSSGYTKVTTQSIYCICLFFPLKVTTQSIYWPFYHSINILHAVFSRK